MAEETTEDVAPQKSSNKALFLAIVFIVGVTALLLLSIRLSKQDYTYNFFPFEKQKLKGAEHPNLWITETQKNNQPYRIPFYYHPTQLLDIVAEENAELILLKASAENPNATIVITLDPDVGPKGVIAGAEISRFTGERYNVLNLKTHSALSRPDENALSNTAIPIANCGDADENTIVVWLTLSQANLIHTEGNCIVLEGQTDEDLKRVADRFAYMLLGIMN